MRNTSLLFALVAGLTACGGSSDSTAPTGSSVLGVYALASVSGADVPVRYGPYAPGVYHTIRGGSVKLGPGNSFVWTETHWDESGGIKTTKTLSDSGFFGITGNIVISYTPLGTNNYYVIGSDRLSMQAGGVYVYVKK